LDEKLAFCRITQLGFLRLLTNRHVRGDEVITPEEAWRVYGTLRGDHRITYLPEPTALAEVWDRFTDGGLTSPNLWTDAYLCEFCSSAGMTLVTFDGKIPDRDDVSCLLLT
jgi:uncharacterized protein